ncbi:MAG TPA: HlyD family efflux transporter periplasmic adaptor subunit, partial [Lacipirellulaceae bacterium]|jgi:HlyD family secretion protein|nr:HlyD family efflux transporter periplasmic adaptor subunit [Lacipirellulaceae bacterium]
MRNIGSKLFMLLVAAAIIAGLAYAFMPRPVDTDLVKIERGTVRVTVDEDGRTRIHDKYVVSAPLNGRILRVNLRPGDKVEAGKTLLTVLEPRDPDLLDARTVAQSEARVKAAEATLQQMQPELEKIHAQQGFAEAELARLRKAFVGKGVSQSDVENAEMLLHQRNEEVRSAKLSEEIARFELEQSQAALMRSRPRSDSTGTPKNQNGAQLAMAELAVPPTANGSQAAGKDSEDAQTTKWDFPIYSPIDGRVLRVMQESSAVVMPGTPLVELGDPFDLEIAVDVLSRDAVKVHRGDEVILEHWGGPTPLHARVRVVEPSGFTKISTLGVEEQRVWIVADLVEPPDERPSLGDEYRVEARIVIDEARNVLRVPTSALFRVGEEPAVFRVENGVAHQRKVKVGRQNGLEAEVAEGLTAGDQVVLHPSDQIEEGTKVRQR